MYSKTRQILLIEDDQNDVDLTVRALKKGRIMNDIATVADGAEALDYIFCEGKYSGRDPSPLPAVVLLDLNLPKIGGLQVLQRLRADERTRLVPVVILTSSREERDLVDGYKFGANSFVQKPVVFDQFTKAVIDLGLYWTLVNAPPPSRI